jgi:hypothetical protein
MRSYRIVREANDIEVHPYNIKRDCGFVSINHESLLSGP